MNKIVLLIMTTSAILLSFSIFAPKVGPEECNLLLSSPACISDGTDDWMGGTGLDYMDITSACIINSDHWTVRFEMTVVGDIPEDPSPRFIGYVWGLDLDQDGMFNEFPPYAHGYTDLNVRVAFDPDPTHGAVFGWHGFIDGKAGSQILYESFSIMANTVSFTLSRSSIYDTTSFLWEANAIASLGGTNLPADVVPDYGLPRASWSRLPPVSATVNIYPDTLNTWSLFGKCITAYIELPEGYSPDDIDISSIRLNGEVQAELHPTGIGDYDEDGTPDLMAKFYRANVVRSILRSGSNLIVVTGTLGGELFEGSDTIRVIGV